MVGGARLTGLRCCVAAAGGDGPKGALLQQMINQEGLQGRVRLAGAIPHEQARDFLVGGFNSGAVYCLSYSTGSNAAQLHTAAGFQADWPCNRHQRG